MISDPNAPRADSTADESFSLFAGGPLYQIAFRIGLVRNEQTVVRLGIAIALLTWTPLLILAAIHEIRLGGVAKPFLLSLGAHARFLIGIPLFFASEMWVGPRLRDLLRQMVDSRLVLPEDFPSLQSIQASATRRRDSILAEVLLAGMVIAATMSGIAPPLQADPSAWRAIGGIPTGAGWWYSFVAIPLFQFLCLRWCWRLWIWIRMIASISRLNLQLIPTHPDMCGGIGYFGVVHSYFCPLSIAISAVLSSSAAEEMLFAEAHLQSFLQLIAGVILLNLLLFLGPLILFSPQLLSAKRQGLKEYGVFAATYTHRFDAKWVQGAGSASREPILGTSDIQSLADLGNSFFVIRNMRLVPFTTDAAIILTVAAVGPMLPLVLFEFSANDVLLKLIKMLSGM